MSNSKRVPVPPVQRPKPKLLQIVDPPEPSGFSSFKAMEDLLERVNKKPPLLARFTRS